MNLREICYMLEIANQGNLTKAANALHMTQPALSKFLSQLEQEVGAPLFTRNSEGLRPTLIGQRYLHYAREIHLSQENWNCECVDLRQERKGRLRIAIPPVRSSSLIAKTLTLFYQVYPDVGISLLEASHHVERYAEMIDAADFVIYGCTEKSPHLQYRELGEEEIVLLAPGTTNLSTYAIQKAGCAYPHLPLRHVGNTPFILSPADQTTGMLGRKILQDSGIEPHVLLETRNPQLSIQMASEGFGLCFAPESYLPVLQLPQTPVAFSVGTPCTTESLCAVYAKGRYLPSYAHVFLDMVAQVFESSVTTQRQQQS